MGTAFERGIGDPNLSTILIGSRGSGKTALLSCIAQEAEQKGWIAVTVVAASGMLEDILQRSVAKAGEYLDPKPRKRLTGIEVAQVLGIEWTLEQPDQGNWRTRISTLLDELAKRDVGLLICVDEVDASVDEMIQLASIYQLLIGEGRRVSLVMAGLPKHTIDLVDNEHVSFLRRARQQHLGAISDSEIARALRASIEDAGKSVDPKAIEAAVVAIGGYAYMMQLVGYCAWESSRNSKKVSEDHVQQGIAQAASDFRVGVLDSTYRDMSKGDLAFAKAMLAEGRGGTLSDVARRMGKKTNYASTYKARLLERGVIDELPDGTFWFAIPMLQEYLAERLL